MSKVIDDGMSSAEVRAAVLDDILIPKESFSHVSLEPAASELEACFATRSSISRRFATHACLKG